MKQPAVVVATDVVTQSPPQGHGGQNTTPQVFEMAAHRDDASEPESEEECFQRRRTPVKAVEVLDRPSAKGASTMVGHVAD